ncbi:MAG: hypothetical protein IKF99_09030 [Oscillospiraceae bacterium]|nr:hypothetical protein [Oscillospiraceae bacterium]
MKLEPANIVCPACGSGNYMRHLIGKNVGYLDMKCINCNSYFNFDELYKRRIGEVLEQKPMTNGDRIRSMSDEDLAAEMKEEGGCPHDCECPDVMDTDCYKCWLDWIRQEAQPC